MEKRLRETMTGKDAAQLEASKSSVPVSRKSGDVQEHADHVTHWVNGKVPGTAAVAYLESAPDGGSLGKLIFKDIADDQKVVKEVDAIAKRFISWDNSKCLPQLQSPLPWYTTFARSSCVDFVRRHGEGGGNHRAAEHHDHGTRKQRPRRRRHTTVASGPVGGLGRRATQATRSRPSTLFRTAHRTPCISCKLTRTAARRSCEPQDAYDSV